jgi:hypothetical protein
MGHAPRIAACRFFGSRPYCTAEASKPRLAMTMANPPPRQKPAMPTAPVASSRAASQPRAASITRAAGPSPVAIARATLTRQAMRLPPATRSGASAV